ncbi:MAG TPA: sulfate ABC transporter ATP-binding protein [Chthoniobacterales bacterium]
MSIEVRDITKKFSRYPALDNVSLKVESGELIALLGPSGSGKTTLLRTIAGLEFPDDDQGRILFDGDDVTHLSAYKRHAGFVFQHYALFSHMNVFENVAFGLRVMRGGKRPPKATIEKRVDELLEAVQLSGYGKRLPNQLSGGQRQRVAFARALAVEPQVLLLDEPFGALDAKVRKELRRWLREFQERVKLTTIFVTHDQDEAFEVADRVVIIDKGKIQQIGSPAEVRKAPANVFVAEFLDLEWPKGSPEPKSSPALPLSA